MGNTSPERSSDVESGYASGASSSSSLARITFTKPHLKHLNTQLGKLSAPEILRWALITLPNLYQTTAFGLTGLVTLDMLSKVAAADPSLPTPDLIFLDTLYHFSQTHDLIDRVRAKYPSVNIHIYKPDGCSTTAEFEEKYGEKVWDTVPELYDWVAKVEPAQRAYTELSAAAVLTGRRRSQGAKRSDLGVLEVDEGGLVKVNPLVNWSFSDVDAYIKEHDVPYNALLDQGYKSVGDWHSTQPVGAGEDERAGRWKGTPKTECGIHNSRSRYGQYLREMELKEQSQLLVKRLEEVDISA